MRARIILSADICAPKSHASTQPSATYSNDLYRRTSKLDNEAVENIFLDELHHRAASNLATLLLQNITKTPSGTGAHIADVLH
jgi:hypothetical protein